MSNHEEAFINWPNLDKLSELVNFANIILRALTHLSLFHLQGQPQSTFAFPNASLDSNDQDHFQSENPTLSRDELVRSFKHNYML